MRDLTTSELDAVIGAAAADGKGKVTVTCCDDNGNCIEIEVEAGAKPNCKALIKIRIPF